MIKKCVRAVYQTMKWSFIVCFVFIVALACFLALAEVRIPSFVCNTVAERLVSTNLFVSCDGVAFGLRRGLRVSGVRVYDRTRADFLTPAFSVDRVEILPFRREALVVGAKYPRLPDSYYAPENTERNARLEATFPEMPPFRVTLEQADILSVRPKRLTARVTVRRTRIDFDEMRLDWAEPECARGLDGSCFIDLDRQELHGKVEGVATQAQIRPMIVALDVPVALPYMDGFTGVKGPVPSTCEWQVNLVNNDFDLWLDLRPKMGEYNTVPMEWATGKIHLHSFTRGTCLNYRTVVGPVDSVNSQGHELHGTVDILGTNGYNEVTVDAKTGLASASVLKIGGFTGRYVDEKVIGDTTGRMTFRFPRAMTNNYEVLNGDGHLRIRNGRLLRLPIFAGLTHQLADKVPGVAFLVEQSEASADYVIENGVIRADDILIEGGVFSIRMSGTFDAVRDELDFKVLVLFTRNDSVMSKYFIRPVTWPFSKLLLEFRLRGQSENPHWEYISIVDRILEAFS